MPIKNFFITESIKARNLGRLAKGDMVNGSPVDLDYFKFQSKDPIVQQAFARVYGLHPKKILFQFPHVHLSDSYYDFINGTNYVAALASTKGFYQVAISDGEWVTAEKYWTTNPISKKPATKWRKLSEGDKAFDQAGYTWVDSNGKNSLLPWVHTVSIELVLPELNAELVNINQPTGTVTLWIRAANEIHTLAENIRHVMSQLERIKLSPRDQLNSVINLMLIREDEIINAQYGGAGFAGVTKAKKSLVRITPSPELSHTITQVEHELSSRYIRQQVAKQLTAPQGVDDINALLFGDDTPAKQLPTPSVVIEPEPIIETSNPLLGDEEYDEYDDFEEGELLTVNLPVGMSVAQIDREHHFVNFTENGVEVIWNGYHVTWENNDLIALYKSTIGTDSITNNQVFGCKAFVDEYGDTLSAVVPRIMGGLNDGEQAYDAVNGVIASLVWALGYKRLTNATGGDAVERARNLYQEVLNEMPF